MAHLRYALYAPAKRGLPWLAVVLDRGDKPIDAFSCADRNAAERVLVEIRARNEAKGDRATA